MDILVTVLLAFCTYMAAIATITNKKETIAYLSRKIELTIERIDILKQLEMDDKMENFIIDSVKALQNDVSLLKVEMAKMKVYVALFSGGAAFAATILKDLIFK